MRQAFFLAALVLVCAGVASRLTYGSDGPAPPSKLKCEYAANPLGIDVRQPRFSWALEHPERGQGQTAYQILVSTQPGVLDRDEGDQWNSSRVASAESTQVVYSGKPLASGRTHYWKVRYWDKQGNPSPYSRPASFEMGLLSREEWKGQWIGAHNLLRKEFKLADQVVRARVYVTALGYYELRINGEKVGLNVLDPAWTAYKKRVLYSTYDITRCLQRGVNAVGVMLGGGWLTQGSKFSAPYRGDYKAPALLLQMNIELADGQRVSVVSDLSWKGKQGPITSDGVYDGEIYDARLEVPGWDKPALDESGWNAVQAMAGPREIVEAQMMPPIRVVDSIVPVAITNPQPGVYVYDMGQNFSGWAQLRVTGAPGTQVEMRFSELLHPDGMINRENISGAMARDIYILRGAGEEVYEPRFTYHGFRYVELTGYPGTPSLDTLRGRVVRTAVQPRGSFAASNPLLNQVQKIVRWTQLNNLHSVPTDCPQRGERLGWMGDAQLSAEAAMLNFDMAAFYTNFVHNIQDTQDEAGTITDTAPDTHNSRPADPAWGAAYPLLCWWMYEQYEDRRLLEENYEGLKKYVEFLRSRAPDHLLRYSSFGDWVAVEATPGEFISATYYYRSVQILAKIAEVLGKTGDAQAYTQLAAQVKEAVNREFLHPGDKKSMNRETYYANGSQTANAIALNWGLVPEEYRGLVAINFCSDVVYGHDTHLTTGIHGTKYLLPALTEVGRADLAYELATQTTYPSWGYMISKGATTVWEVWQFKTGPGMNSHDHPALASVGAWFYRTLGGINVGSGGAGYRHIQIQPHMVEDLKWASASVETLRGTVACAWSRQRRTITMDVQIPVNSDAVIGIPKVEEMTEVVVREGGQVVWEKGQFVPGCAGVTGARQSQDGRIHLEVGSGRYSFVLTGR